MILPQVSAQEWAEAYGLEVKDAQCMKCKKMFPRDIPFAVKGFRGLMTEDHGCGKEYQSSVAMPVGETLDKFKGILG